VSEQPDPRPAAADTRETSPRTGIVFCRCGPNLGTLVQVGALEEPARWPEAADVATHAVLCSEEGKAWLRQRLSERGLERLVVAACSPREHEATFRGVMAAAGRNPFLVQLVNLREQVEWIGGEAEQATRRAERLVRGGLARVARHRPIETTEIEVCADVLVVGGGAAGVSAALALARKDRKVVLVERAPALGGLANQLDEIFPDLTCASCFMEPALDEVLHHQRIEVLTSAEVRRVRGSAGRFEVDLELAPRYVDPAACVGCGQCATLCPVERPDPWSGGLGTARAIGPAYPGSLPHVSSLDPRACLHHQGGSCDACQVGCAFGAIRLDAAPERRAVSCGAVVVATGLRPGEVDGPPGTLSTYQLERMLHPNGPTAGALARPDGRPVGSLLLATTAAETDGTLPVRELLKLAHLVRVKHPGTRVAVAGGLGRAPGHAAEARRAAEDGVELLEADLAADGLSDGGGRVAARLSRGALEEVRAFDLVAVHAPARAADGARELAALLRLQLDEGGFAGDAGASPFEPTATRVAGVFVAGAAAGPRSIRESIRDGAAAAGRVLATLVAGERRTLEPLSAEVEAARCGACGVCISTCPYGAVSRDPATGKARVEPVHCHGCGSCAAACPTGAASARHYTREQIAAEIRALLAGAG
jgi:heterodisulfide reductase subunit A